MKNNIKQSIFLVGFLIIFISFVLSWRVLTYKKLENTIVLNTQERLVTVVESESVIISQLINNYFVEDDWLAFMNDFNGRTGKIGKDGYMWIIDDKGIVKYHPYQQYIGKSAIILRRNILDDGGCKNFEDIIGRMKRGEKGYGDYTSIWSNKDQKKVKKIVAFCPLEVNKNKWSIAVSIGYVEISSPIVINKYMDIFGVIVIFIFTCIVGYIFYKKQKKIDETSIFVQTEHELRESKDFIRRVIDTIPLLVFVKDYEGHYILANQTLADMLGVTVEKIEGKKDIDFMGSTEVEEANRYTDADKKVITTQEEMHIYEEKSTDSKGNIVYFNTIKYPLTIGEKSDYVLGVSTNITERKMAEEKIESLAKFPGENSNPVLRIDHDGKLIYANNASEALLELWGSNVGGYVPSSFTHIIKECLLEHIVKTKDIKINGNILTLSFTPIRDDYINIYGSDITDIKAAEEELRKANEGLEEFAYITSHDLQEPLRTVFAYSQLLKNSCYDRLSEEEQKFLNYLMSGSQRMKILVKELLDYSRVGKSRDASGIERVNIGMLLDEIFEDSQVYIKETNAIITVQKHMPTIIGSRLRIKQLFHNLISNALKFRGQQQPIIKIGYRELDDANYWEFYVEDNGIGIDPQFHDRIFGIFKRLYSREEYPGTGIGLALCKKIVETHAGDIWVESEANKGTIIYFTIAKS
jgi:PAS domain S-box-containing protein